MSKKDDRKEGSGSYKKILFVLIAIAAVVVLFYFGLFLTR